jgi:hypothetical protein
MKEAYDGLEDDMLGAYATAEDTEGDVARGCLKALRLYKDRLDQYYGYTKALAEAGFNLQAAEFSALAQRAGSESNRYRKGREWVLRDCEPR